ncbi:MAG TPA: sulfate/molybdate ABC transporter ATP-binding protein [Polyangiaceae bacterium]|nr:sulfate/molybdate ABC transporter ATP-binding protein [Polyangiaceae bacterium]
MTVHVEFLEKRFGDRREVVGVDKVSFTAKEHGITSLLGPSGSGKSTLLRLVAGLEVPDAGRVFIDGQDVTEVPVKDRQIGFVFQNYALFRHMSVFDNVAFGPSIQKKPKSEIADRVAELLSLVQLRGYEHRLPDQLSGGQRQRVALARALATSPRVLLLDEPFGALDTRVRVELREWLHLLHEKTQVTTLLVTHDQEEALELSEHVILLKDGKIEQAGSPVELYESPASAFVASFLGGAKVLTGSVADGKVQFAQEGLSASVGDLEDGAVVDAFVRPHDIRLEKVGKGGGGTGLSRVLRVVRIGAYVKVSVLLPDGDSIYVQVPRHELDEQGIAEGDRVVLDLREVRVTQRPPSYVI